MGYANGWNPQGNQGNDYPRKSRGSYQGNRGSYQGNQGNAPYKKHSGCKLKTGWFSKTTGESIPDSYIYGWNYSKSRGLISFIASPKKANKETGKSRKTSKPDLWENWTVKMSYNDGRKPEFFNGLFNKVTKRLHINDLQMIANPAKDYFGALYKRK